MLPFKKPGIVEEEVASIGAPRWKIGIEKERVIIYVAIAVAAGFLLGYVTARYLWREAEQRPAERAKVEEAAAPKTAVNQPASAYRRVNRILRADTVEVDQIGVVRLIGVESPDGKLPAETYEAHGKNALAFTEKSLLNQEVRVDFDPAFAPLDHLDAAGQKLAYLYLSDGKLFNAELIKQGHAFVREEPFTMLVDFQGYEREAIAVMRGLWGPTNPADPAVAATTPAATATNPTRPGRLSPLSPSEIGPNIPAASGSSGAVSTSSSEAMVFVSAPEKIYHKNGCELLGKKKQAVPLSQAKSSGHVSCGRCFPSTSMKAN